MPRKKAKIKQRKKTHKRPRYKLSHSKKKKKFVLQTLYLCSQSCPRKQIKTKKIKTKKKKHHKKSRKSKSRNVRQNKKWIIK